MRRDAEFLFVPAKPPDDGGWPGLRPSSTVVDGIVVEIDVPVTLRDGTRVYVDVRRPDRYEPVPVLIAYAPYGKHLPFPEILLANAGIEPPLPDCAPFEAPLAEYWVPHGYAVVYADPRGAWGSEGDQTQYSVQQAEDGYDLVEWAGTQPWSNGRVGLSGVSYLAMTQYGIASLRPPHLAAINPSDGISDLYRESVFQGGILETQFTANVSVRSGYGLNRTEDVRSEMLGHPFIDDLWESKNAELEAIHVPAFFVCSVGNQGLHTRGTLEAYRRASSAQKWLDIHGSKEWRYYYRPENMDRQRAFFDHFLKGLDTEIASWPLVSVELRDQAETGPVRHYASWPIPNTRHIDLHLDASTGTMLREPTIPASVSYDPAKSPPREAGRERATFDVTFDTEMALAGYASLTVWVESPGAANIDLFVTLDKIGADGRRVNYPFFACFDDGPLATGWMRATRRELDPERSTPEQPVQAHKRDLPLPEGPVQLDIEIWPLTALFHTGETLRLTIAGADINRWPPEQFAPGHDFLANTAPHIIHTGGENRSVLLLPVVP